ncbi:site-specific integrase [Paraburkholderia caribensis]|uniref:site-specific integrase n=1 Tax=Paraburkholderia caribensis TaxID=75105 RepID=UPI002863E6C9|nr:site-specific integrase [Paraburkholderia caribensis]MDR6383995.1 integrase [Paraburkholderia caribensis]
MGKAKKLALRSLPPNWREAMWDCAAAPEWQRARPQLLPALAVLWLIGCRPSEIEHGIHLAWRDHLLVLEVAGTKCVDAGQRERGQPRRRYAFETGAEKEALCPALTVLRLRALEATTDRIGRGVVSHDADYLYNSVVALGRATFPKMRTRVSPYCFRHQHASDLKADPDIPLEEAAKAMGHLSDYSIGKYGHATHGGKGGRVKALMVETSRPVRHSPKVDRLARFKIASARRRDRKPT